MLCLKQNTSGLQEQSGRVENGLVDTVAEGKEGVDLERSIDIYTLSCIKQLACGKLIYNTESPDCYSGDLDGRMWGVGKEAQEGGGIILMTDTHYMAKTNKTVYINDPLI